MPKLPIDLAMSYDGPYAVSQAPSPEKHYPGTRLEWESDYKLPDEGEITFKYRITRSVEEKKVGKFSEELDFLKIVDVKPSKEARDEREEASANLDKLRDEYD